MLIITIIHKQKPTSGMHYGSGTVAHTASQWRYVRSYGQRVAGRRC